MNKELDIYYIIELFKKGEIDKAELLLDKYEGEKAVDYWLLKGSVCQKKQKWGMAINAYQKVLDLEPGNNEAKINLEIIHNILNFWNPDMLNA